MKKMGISIALVGALALLSGCGGSGDDSSSDGITGIGYYLDSAVAGVTYACGVKSGITDKDGRFTFEKGKDCTFTLAGMELRNVKVSLLIDGV